MYNTEHHNPDIEQYALSCLTRAGRSVLSDFKGRLKPHHFLTYRALAEVVLELMDANLRPDLTTVQTVVLPGSKEEQQAERLAEIPASDRPTPRNLTVYVDELATLHQRRVMESAGTRLVMASSGREEYVSVIHEVERQLGEAIATDGRGPALLSTFIDDALDDMRNDSGTHITGVRSGLRKVDRRTRGWQDDDLIIIAARPSMGKTSYALKTVYTACCEDGNTGLVFSLEMNRQNIFTRLVAGAARVPVDKVDAHMTDPAFKRVVKRLRSVQLIIDDRQGLTVKQLAATAQSVQARHGLDFVVVDFLTLIRRPPGEGTDSQKVGAIARGLKQMASTLGVPVICLSQINRGNEKRTDDVRPRMSDLRASGEIEEIADVIQGLYRDAYYTRGEHEEPTDEAIAEVITLKHRNGSVGTDLVTFIAPYAWFEDYIEPERYSG